MMLQCGPFCNIMLGVHRNGMYHSESCYKGTILQRNYRKMTIMVIFLYLLGKISWQKNWEPQHDCFISKYVLYPNLCYNEVC